MSERQFENRSRTKHTPEAAAFSANVRLPQTFLAMVPAGLERRLKDLSAEQVVESILAPIPMDDALRLRTQRANAQHTHHHIGKVLTTERVRDLQAEGNLRSLLLLGLLLDVPVPSALLDEGEAVVENGIASFDEQGNWATEADYAYGRAVQEALATTPDKAFLIRLFETIARTLASDALKDALRAYKEAYADWETKSGVEQTVAFEAGSMQMELVQDELQRAFEELVESRGGSEQEREMVKRLISFFFR